MMDFSQMILCFTLYSFAGFVVESAVCSILARRAVNRGFLGGPFCPLYGFYALLALAIAGPEWIRSMPPVAFAACALLLTALKFIASWLLEKLFSLRLWDHTGSKLNLKGRIFWLDVPALGLIGSAIVYLIQPGLLRLISTIDPAELRVLASVLVGIFALSTYRAVSSLSRLDALLRTLKESGCAVPEAAKKGDGAYAGCFRLLNAYPRLRIPGFQAELDCLHRQWDTSHEGFMKRLRQVAGAFGHRTTETVKSMNPFAHGVSFHKLVWVFAIGCVLGYLIETAFCLVVRGVIESRQGMVYGPFNQVYGIGAVLMTLLLEPLSEKGDGVLFAGGALVGGAFEFVASWLQEKVLGSVSWEYSDQAFSVGGRTSLLFMFFWGILGVLYIRQVYPRLSGLIERIPSRQGAFFSWVIILSLTSNMAISFAAVNRWIGRQNGNEASSAYEAFLDEHYPNAMMEEIYPSMMVVGEDGARPTRTNL